MIIVRRIFLLLLFFLMINSSSGQMQYGFSAPDAPTLYTRVDHHRVYLAWDDVAEASIDSLTGYMDFEGYRIYKSTDGGVTWGGADAELYDYEGNFVGWSPYAQFDLTAEEDEEFCIYEQKCADLPGLRRGIDISGPDPLNPRFSLGENSGLEYTFIDTNVTDGVQYTYSVVAYDIGLRTYTVEFTDDNDDGVFEADTIWSPSNPDHFLGPDSLNGRPNPTRGFLSLESPKGSSEDDSNFDTVVPGYYASNFSFPSDEELQSLFMRQQGTIGTGDIKYIMVEQESLADVVLKFEVQAAMGSETFGDFEGMATMNPDLYVYEIDDIVSQTPVNIKQTYNVSNLSQSQIDSLQDLPGAISSGSEISIPQYEIIAEMNIFSDIVNGIRFRFDNTPIFRDNTDIVFVNDVDWFVADSSIIEVLDGELTYASSIDATFTQRLNYDYKIEFFSTPVDTVTNSSCLVPFKVTNLTTGQHVGLKNLDQGYNFPYDAPFEGFGDCEWTRTEPLTFQADTLLMTAGQLLNGDTLQADTAIAKITLELRLDYNLGALLPGLPDWSNTESYSKGDMVLARAMAWRAIIANTDVEPFSYIDNNDDGVNDSPWQPYYPWETGDSLIIRLQKFFTDGDSWVVDMSELGKTHEVVENDLDLIRVVPNPYIVHSAYNEKVGSRLLRFTRLPNECRILIYTITGELVTSLEQNDPYEGNLWWNLRTGHNQDGPEVAPGLYIYVVEAGDLQRVGKFAIVR